MNEQPQNMFPRVLIADIQEVTARHFRIPVSEMQSSRRGKKFCRPRQVAMYLARELTPKSYPEIGRFFGDRDHTTVLHGCHKIAELILTDPDIEFAVMVLREKAIEVSSKRFEELRQAA